MRITLPILVGLFMPLCAFANQETTQHHNLNLRMSNIDNYKIASGNSHIQLDAGPINKDGSVDGPSIELEQNVNALLKKGYHLYGDLKTVCYQDYCRDEQPMIKFKVPK